MLTAKRIAGKVRGARPKAGSDCGKAEDGSGKRGGIRIQTFPSELLGPPPCPMKYTDYIDSIISDSIWNDVRRARHYQFTGADHSAGPANRGMAGEPGNCRLDRRNDSSCSCRAVLRDVLGFSVEIGSCFAEPLNAHAASTS